MYCRRLRRRGILNVARYASGAHLFVFASSIKNRCGPRAMQSCKGLDVWYIWALRVDAEIKTHGRPDPYRMLRYPASSLAGFPLPYLFLEVLQKPPGVCRNKRAALNVFGSFRDEDSLCRADHVSGLLQSLCVPFAGRRCQLDLNGVSDT